MDHPLKHFVEVAIQEALEAKSRGDYSIGASIIFNDDIIVKDGNKVILTGDPTNHAEIVVIRSASQIFERRSLEGCVLYTTHEPCPMCMSAAIWAKLDGIVYGAAMEDMENYWEEREKNSTYINRFYSWRTINIKAREILERSNSKMFLIENFMGEECKKLFHSNCGEY